MLLIEVIRGDPINNNPGFSLKILGLTYSNLEILRLRKWSVIGTPNFNQLVTGPNVVLLNPYKCITKCNGVYDCTLYMLRLSGIRRVERRDRSQLQRSRPTGHRLGREVAGEPQQEGELLRPPRRH